jgi:pimeloyl-ACP methyl ester carboxylesterase
MLTTALSGLLLAYGLLLLAACGLQDRLIYFPETGRANDATPAALHIPYQDVTFATADGERLHGWFIAATEARATVVLFHGNAGNITHRLSWLPMFQRLRLSALLFDYRGYGTSTGTPSESGTYADADAAWRYLTETAGLPPDRGSDRGNHNPEEHQQPGRQSRRYQVRLPVGHHRPARLAALRGAVPHSTGCEQTRLFDR